MIHANFYGATNKTLYLRQTFRSAGVYRNVQFSVDNPDAEWQIVGTWELAAFAERLASFPPHQKFIYQQQEPPEMLWPTARQLQGCRAIMTPRVIDVDGPPQFIGPPCLAWLYGLNMEMRQGVGHWYSEEGALALETLAELDIPQKSRLCSMIVSRKSFLPGHQARLDFLHTLQQHFKGRIDFYGFGFNPVSNKRDAIDPYLFSVAIENSEHPHYWTEKIADVFLGYTMPIYHGAPNIDTYFSRASMQVINIHDVDASVASIEQVLDHPERFDIQRVAQERLKVLTDYNHLNWMAATLETMTHNPA